MKKFHFDLIVSSVVLVAMIVVILIQIIFRLMGNPLSWTEEVARWMLVWATFAGASYAFKNGGLIRVDFFVKKLFKKKGRRITDIAAMMFMIVYFGLLGVSAASYMKMTISKGQTYPITQVPYAITLISLVYCGLSCCIFAVKEGLKAYHSTDTLLWSLRQSRTVRRKMQRLPRLHGPDLLPSSPPGNLPNARFVWTFPPPPSAFRPA